MIGTFASEWTKLTTLRSTKVWFALAVLLAVALTALIGIVSGVTWDDWDAADRAEFSPAETALAGTVLTLLVMTVVGVKAVASEYASGMMRLSLTATPRRGRLLAAKLAVVCVATQAVALVAAIATMLVGATVLGAYDLPTAGPFDDGVPRALIGTVLLAPILPLIGATAAMLLRNTAGAIVLVLALVFGPGMATGLLPTWWDEHVLDLTPSTASDTIAMAQMPSVDPAMPLGVAFVVIAAWIGGLAALSWWTLERRDA